MATQFKILEKLRHHYIVRSEDSFEEEDELILIMEYCGGKTVGKQRRISAGTSNSDGRQTAISAST